MKNPHFGSVIMEMKNNKIQAFWQYAYDKLWQQS